ncbi:MAG TPA: hypothetical protein VEC96_18110 [Anaerolineae bacterium]|nr:hypothetical protein [Anaerolineae bacterium]
MINNTCFKCKRRFELDPVFVGFELSKLKKQKPNYYQAVCPACRAINKISISQMQADLDSVAEEIKTMVADYEESAAKARAERQAKAKEKAKAGKK